MRTRARGRSAGVVLALAAALLLAAAPIARAADRLALGGASLGTPDPPDMCPAKRARQSESQLFGMRQQLAARLPLEPADPGIRVLNTHGANYGSNYGAGQRLADPALLHLERALPH